MLEHLDGSTQRLGVEVIVEGVRPQHHARGIWRGTGSPCAEPAAERLLGEDRYTPIGSHSGSGSCDPEQPRRLRQRIDESRRERGEASPLMD